MRRLAHWVVALAVCGAACSNTDTAATTVTPVSYDVIGQVADVDLSRWIAEFDSDGRLLGGPGTITLDDGTRIDVARGTPARNDCTEFGGPARSRTACVVVAMLRADTTQAEWFVGQPASVGDDGELSLSVEAIDGRTAYAHVQGITVALPIGPDARFIGCYPPGGDLTADPIEYPSAAGYDVAIDPDGTVVGLVCLDGD